MKIGVVLSRTPEYSETFFISKIKGLQESGFHVTLFVQQKLPDFKLCPVKSAPKVYKRNRMLQWVYSIMVLIKLLGYPRRLLNFVMLEKKAKRSKTQILKNLVNNAHLLTAHLDWIHFGFATMALQSEHVAKAIGAKMAVSLRGYDIAIYPKSHPECYDLLWKRIDKVHSISNDLLLLAIKLGMRKDTPYKIIYPAIDITNFEAKNKTMGKINSQSELQLLTIARLHWKKGVRDTLEALAVLKQKGILFTYKIIGVGNELESLIFAAHQLQLENNVVFIGKIKHSEVTNYLSKAHVYLQYSISEGFCNAVLEAQAMGLLCIVSDAEGLPENIVHEKTGWVIPKKRPDLLSEAILNVINLSDEAKTNVVTSAQKRVRDKFNLEIQREQFNDFYT